MTQRATAVAVTALCVGVLLHVDLGFERVRRRVVTTPVVAETPELRIDLPHAPELAGRPAAIIARILPAAGAMAVQLSVDGQLIARVALNDGTSTRVDAAAVLAGQGPHELTVTGDRAGWQLQYLELANVHGYTEGLLGLTVLPREAPRQAPVPWWLVTTFAIALLSLVPAPGGWPAARWARVAHRVGVVMAVGLFLLTLAAPLVSPYRLLLAPPAFLIGMAVLFAGSLSAGLRGAWAHSPPFHVAASYLPHAALGFVVCTAVAAFHHPVTGFSELIAFGSQFWRQAVPEVAELPVAVQPGSGYDGQFYAQLALDPLMRDPATIAALDSPAYRARRVLMSAAAWGLGLGAPEAVVDAYALLNVVCWLFLGIVLLRWLPPTSPANVAAWMGAMTSHGFFMSIRFALTDGPAALLVAIAILALDLNRRWTSALLLAAAALTKETSLIAASVLLPGRLRSGADHLRVGGQIALAVLPFAAWLVYLAALDLPGQVAGARNFAWPLVAYAADWSSTSADVLAGTPWAWDGLLTLVALTTQAAVLLWKRDWTSAWWRVGAGYALLMIVVGPAVWEGHPGAITRVVLPMSLAFNVLLPGTRGFPVLWILGNAYLAGSFHALGLSWRP